jgi:hypothetical protein
MKQAKNITDALKILSFLGLPRAQQNERSALCLLALLNLSSNKKWIDAEAPLIGITPIMDWSRSQYGKEYAPNTRETFRRQTMHQFVSAGIALYNPDDTTRSVNSPKAVYQIAPDMLALLRTYGSPSWPTALAAYLTQGKSLAKRYASERAYQLIPIRLAKGKKIKLSPGKHNELIKAIIEEFASRFVPGGILIYVGDTGNKWGYFDDDLLTKLGVKIDSHGKMPDVVLFHATKKWLILIEAVTSHGPVDGKRHEELVALFAKSKAPLVFITSFPNRSIMAKYLGNIAWETEVWVADNPSHLIHFNGDRFLGPY